MNWDEAYWKDVQATVDRLRTACLGQDIPFSVLLPQHIQKRPEPDRAAYLADLLLFSLSKRAVEEGELCLNLATAELKNAHEWLYGIILYLITQCNEKDCIFGNILRLIQLEWATRAVMFADLGKEYDTICRQLHCPGLLEGEGLELIILRLAEERGMLIQGRKMYRWLQRMIQNS